MPLFVISFQVILVTRMETYQSKRLVCMALKQRCWLLLVLTADANQVRLPLLDHILHNFLFRLSFPLRAPGHKF